MSSKLPEEGRQEGSDSSYMMGLITRAYWRHPTWTHVSRDTRHTCHTLGQWSQSYPLLPRTVKWIQMDVLQPQSPLKNSGSRFCWRWPGLGAASCWRLGSGVNLVMSWFMKTGDSRHQPSQAARLSELFYLRAITKMLQHQPDILQPDAGAGAGEGDLICSLFHFMFTTLNRLRLDVCFPIL